MSQFLQRIKFVKFRDIATIPLMLLSLCISPIFKMFHRNIWLICERENEARDNGYWFYKFLCEKHSEINSVYAIRKKSSDYIKVEKMGKVIEFGSFTHWLYYWSANWNISSQKEGKPNAAICFVLEVYLGFRKNRIYLKHGVTKDAQRWIYNDVSKLTMICCSSKYEQRYVQENFGYPKEAVKLTGLCRFDNLISNHENKRQIVVMPTMREWLRVVSSDTMKYENKTSFTESEYYKTWMNFIKSEKLKDILLRYNIDLLFYPHPAMQKYLETFSSTCDRVKIASAKNYDMQELLIESSLLITDYSSVFFDFAYMNKPLLYYQFDYEKYRLGQYQEGYFSYEKNGFGAVCYSENDLLKKLEAILNDDLKNSVEYESKMLDFFAFRDAKNCMRVYNAILELKRG